jgi:hypothetical protein
MKNNLYLLLLTTITFLLAGCPVETSVPLISRSQALSMDESIVGVWKNANSDAEIQEMRVTASSAKNVYILRVLKSSDAYWGEERFDAWFVSYNGYTYLITQPYHDAGPAEKYYAHLASIFPKKMLITEFNLTSTDESEISNSEEFKEAIRKNFQNDDFLDTTEEWRKQP